jgi:hypothetical protein
LLKGSVYTVVRSNQEHLAKNATIYRPSGGNRSAALH